MNHPDVQIVNRHLLIDGKEVIAAPYGVDTFIWIDDEKLALVLWTRDFEYILNGNRISGNKNDRGRNVICINTRGEVQWIMENHMDNPYRSNGGSPVSKIEMTDAGYWPGNIVGWNGDHCMVIDKNTGKLLYIDFTK
ncbi:MAG: hypothetical protein ACOYXR_09070 [Nitrospirota bacterium]